MVAASFSTRLRTVRCSIRLSTVASGTMRLTKMPGVMMWSGSIWPVLDQVLDLRHHHRSAAVAMIGLKFRAVFR